MTKLSVHFLGECKFIYNGEVVSGLQTKRLRLLLGYLLLHPDQQISATQLAFLFWPDSPEKQARTNLRRQFYNLRKAFPQSDSFFERADHSVRWRADSDYVLDIDQFEQWLDKAALALQLDQFESARESLVAAVECYHGDLLPDCYDDWILVHRERIRQAYLNAIEELMKLFEAKGDYGQAIAYGEQLLREDSLREHPYRALMKLHTLNGDRAAALRVYHACAAELERELGVEPDNETTALYERLLHTDTEAALRVDDRKKHVAEHSRLVGRQDERRQLFSAWRKAAEGQPLFVLIRGEAGIGKTRLSEELYHWAVQLGIDAARARAYAASATLSYAPVLDWLRAGTMANRLATLDPIWRSELSRLLPAIQHDYPHTPSPQPLAAEWQRLRFFEALARVVCTDRTPTLLLIDDLQWCDGETLAWIQFLIQFDPQAPLLLVGTQRDEQLVQGHPLSELVYHLGQLDRLIEIGLDRLNVEEIRQLGSQIAGEDLTPDESKRLVADAGGNPLFAVEMVRAGLMSADDGVEQSPHIPRLSSSDEPPNLPPKVYNVIQSRLTQLSPSASALAALAATIGKSFSFDLLGRSSELDADQLVQNLDELWRRRIIQEKGAGSKEFAYDFSHDRLRDVAYAEISPIRRRFFHRAIAAAMTALYGEQFDERSAEIAHHHERAGNPLAAATFYRIAGERAAGQFAHGEAVAHYSRALTLLGEEDPAAQFTLLGLRERTFHLQANRHRQQADLTSMMALAERLEDESRRAMVLLRRAERAEGQGRYDDAVGFAQDAIHGAKSVGNRLLEAEAQIRLGSLYWNWGDYERSKRVYRQGLEIAQRLGEHGLETTILLHLGALYVYYAPYDDAQQICREALASAKRCDDIEGEIWAQNQLGYLIVEQGDNDYDEAELLLCRGREMARKIGHRPHTAKLSSNLSRLYDRRGDGARALGCLDESLTIAEETGSSRHRAFALSWRANTRANEGDLIGASTDCAEALSLFEAIGYRQGEGMTLSELSLLATLQGEFVNAQRLAERALAIAGDIGLRRDQAYALTRLGYAREGQGRGQDARDVYVQAIAHFTDTGQQNRMLEPIGGLIRIAYSKNELRQLLPQIDQVLARLQNSQLDVVNETALLLESCRLILKTIDEARLASVVKVLDELDAKRPGMINTISSTALIETLSR